MSIDVTASQIVTMLADLNSRYRRLQHPHDYASLAVHPDGRWVAVMKPIIGDNLVKFARGPVEALDALEAALAPLRGAIPTGDELAATLGIEAP